MGVGFRLAHDLPYSLFAGLLINQSHCGSEFDGITGKLGYVDDFGARELVFQFRYSRLINLLLRLGSLIF